MSATCGNPGPFEAHQRIQLVCHIGMLGRPKRARGGDDRTEVISQETEAAITAVRRAENLDVKDSWRPHRGGSTCPELWGAHCSCTSHRGSVPLHVLAATPLANCRKGAERCGRNY